MELWHQVGKRATQSILATGEAPIFAVRAAFESPADRIATIPPRRSRYGDLDAGQYARIEST